MYVFNIYYGRPVFVYIIETYLFNNISKLLFFRLHVFSLVFSFDCVHIALERKQVYLAFSSSRYFLTKVINFFTIAHLITYKSCISKQNTTFLAWAS